MYNDETKKWQKTIGDPPYFTVSISDLAFDALTTTYKGAQEVLLLCDSFFLLKSGIWRWQIANLASPICFCKTLDFVVLVILQPASDMNLNYYFFLRKDHFIYRVDRCTTYRSTYRIISISIIILKTVIQSKHSIIFITYTYLRILPKYRCYARVLLDLTDFSFADLALQHKYFTHL